MSNNSNQISEAILKAIDIISDKKISKAEFSSTIQGIIVKCQDASLGKYLIKYQDSLLEAYSTSPSVSYNKDTLVYIFVPNGNLKNYKVILGTTKQLGTNYIEEFMGEEYFDTGENFISSDYTIKMSSYLTKQYVLYKRGSKNNIISLSNNVTSEIRNANFLKMTGTIQTNLPYDQKRNGHYGIRVTLIIKNSATGVSELQDYYFDNNNFLGNPYEYTTASNQIVSCQVDSSNFVAVDSITCFIQDFPNQVGSGETAPPADIFIYNFTINGSYKLTESEKSSVAIILKANRGYTFGKNASENDIRPIVASLRAKMKEVNLAQQNVQIYWFMQDLKITSNSDQFSNYGGMGWKCLNTRVGPNRFNSSSSIKIKEKDVAYSKQTKFKCVAVYDGKICSKQFSIFNQKASYQVTLTSSQGTSFHHSAGHPNLICQVWKQENGNKKEITNQANKIFKWQVCNYQNKTTNLKENKTSYQNALTQKEKINKKVGKDANIYWNSICKEEVYYKDFDKNFGKQSPLNKTYKIFYNLYNQIISNYENNQHLERNILYNVKLQEIINFSTFRCSCYEKSGNTEKLIGTTSIKIKNTLAPSDGYTLIINHGDQTFLYDEEGSSLHSNAIDEPYQIFDLSYTLYYNGKEIKQEDLQNGTTATWKIPTTNTMLNITGGNVSNGYRYITDTKNNLPINVKNTYNNNLNNNDIYLILQYKDQTFITKTNFTFSKQGQNGTNGTKYQFKLKVKDDAEPIIIYKNGKWSPEKLIIQPELWNNGTKREISSGFLNWKILKDNLKNSFSMLNDVKPVLQSNNLKNRQFNLQKNPQIKEELCNIIEAQYSRTKDGYKYYADLPISSIIVKNTDNNYNIKIKPNTCFRYITYKSDGTKPSYKNNKPFEVNIYKNFGSIEEEVTNYANENFSYQWKIFPTNGALLSISGASDKNTCTVIPSNIFTRGNQVSNALVLTINKNKNLFAQVHIPIHFMLNRYENRALNDWNGTAIEINKNDGYILTPQVGAGTKNNDNSFTGIVMGQARTKNSNETGLFGYAAGARSIFLDAKTGNATFGLATKGQIKIDVNGNATIKSNDYPNAGMQIQFSNSPHIKFGSGNFEVESNGHIHAKGGGDIAGWQISNKALSKGRVKLSSDNSSSSNKAIQVTDSKNKNIFSVDYRGYLHSQQGDIAGWTIEPTRLYKNNVGMASTGTHAFWAGDDFYVNHNGYLFSKSGNIGGWNISSNKLSYNNDKVGLSPSSSNNLIWAKDSSGNIIFSVNNDGYMYAKNGSIGNWRFGNNGLYSPGDASTFNGGNSGVYVGSDGIRLGSTFYVEPNGYLYAIDGNIGGCNISAGGISSRNNSWYITGGGDAKFTDVIINGARVTDMMRASGSGGISGGGSSIGSGGASLDRGSTTVGGKNIDKYVEDLVVGTITADFIYGKIAQLNYLNVRRLKSDYQIEVDGKTLYGRDIQQIRNNEGDIANLKAFDLKHIQNDIETLKDQIETLGRQIGNLQERINNLPKS